MAQKLENRWNYLNSFVRGCIKENFQVFHTRQFGRTRYRIQYEIQCSLYFEHCSCTAFQSFSPKKISGCCRSQSLQPDSIEKCVRCHYLLTIICFFYYYLFSIHLNLWEILLTNQCCPKLSLVLVVHTSSRRGKGVVGRSN